MFFSRLNNISRATCTRTEQGIDTTPPTFGIDGTQLQSALLLRLAPHDPLTATANDRHIVNSGPNELLQTLASNMATTPTQRKTVSCSRVELRVQRIVQHELLMKYDPRGAVAVAVVTVLSPGDRGDRIFSFVPFGVCIARHKLRCGR